MAGADSNRLGIALLSQTISALSRSLALSFCTLIISHFKGFVKGFLKFLSKDFFYSVRPSPLASCGLLLTSLTLYHNLGDLSRGFLHFFSRTGFEPAIFPHSGREFPISLPLPLTLQIIAHLPIECNRQNTQNRDFYFPKLCATFRLTNCWRCVIMEILRASLVGAPPKKPPQKWGGFRISWAVLRPWTESSSEPCPRLTYTLRRGRVPGVRESLPPAVLPGWTLPRRYWG